MQHRRECLRLHSHVSGEAEPRSAGDRSVGGTKRKSEEEKQLARKEKRARHKDTGRSEVKKALAMLRQSQKLVKPITLAALTPWT